MVFTLLFLCFCLSGSDVQGGDHGERMRQSVSHYTSEEAVAALVKETSALRQKMSDKTLDKRRRNLSSNVDLRGVASLSTLENTVPEGEHSDPFVRSNRFQSFREDRAGLPKEQELMPLSDLGQHLSRGERSFLAAERDTMALADAGHRGSISSGGGASEGAVVLQGDALDVQQIAIDLLEQSRINVLMPKKRKHHIEPRNVMRVSYDPRMKKEYAATEQDCEELGDQFNCKTLAHIVGSDKKIARNRRGVETKEIMKRHFAAKSEGLEVEEYTNFIDVAKHMYTQHRFDDDMSLKNKDKLARILWWFYLGLGRPSAPKAFFNHFIYEAADDQKIDWFLNVVEQGVRMDETYAPFLRSCDSEYVGVNKALARQKKRRFVRSLKEYRAAQISRDQEVLTVEEGMRKQTQRQAFIQTVSSMVTRVGDMESKSELHKKAINVSETAESFGVLAQAFLPAVTVVASGGLDVVAQSMNPNSGCGSAARKVATAVRKTDGSGLRMMTSAVQMGAAVVAQAGEWHHSQSGASEVIDGLTSMMAPTKGAPICQADKEGLCMDAYLHVARKDPKDPTYLIIEDYGNDWKHVLWMSLKNAASTGCHDIIFTVNDKRMQKTQLQQMALTLTGITLDLAEVPLMAQVLVLRLQNMALDKTLKEREFVMLATSAGRAPKQLYEVRLPM